MEKLGSTLEQTIHIYNLHLSSEQLEFRDTVRDFVALGIKPIAVKPERLEPFKRPLLTEILDKASQMGLRTMALSDNNGGAGADNLTSCIVTEELAVGDADIAVRPVQTSTLSRVLFDRLLSPAMQYAVMAIPFCESLSADYDAAPTSTRSPATCRVVPNGSLSRLRVATICAPSSLSGCSRRGGPSTPVLQGKR